MSKKQLIDVIKPHTEMKLQLIENYVKDWAPILLRYDKCRTIIFIDCMCNCGEYKNLDGDVVIGTPVRVTKVFQSLAKDYPDKHFYLYFNDYDSDRIEHLKELIDNDLPNVTIITSCADANQFLLQIKRFVVGINGYHYLLVYDPYKADIKWDSLAPYLNGWGEVILNHMVSDSIRGLPQTTKVETMKKYEATYLKPYNDLVPYGTDRKAYEARINEIIHLLRSNGRDYYVASFPFFNRTNILVYDLVHCTSNIKGFKLYKKTAWKTFNGKSSAAKEKGEGQLLSLFDKNEEDSKCLYIGDIAEYLFNHFKGCENVPRDNVFSYLDLHPIFPSDGFRREIVNELRDRFGVKVTKTTLSFK